jgi:2-polyprenyl-3-methyl-5-hydroxy-6-metoxy-1,4-benzoquinol methylase
MRVETVSAIKKCLKLPGGRSRPDKSFPFVAEKLKGQTGKILDVGCGRGSFGFLIHTEFPHAFTVHGVEIHQPYIDKTPYKKFYHDIFIDDYSKHSYRYMTFDIYLLVDVLEHFDRQTAIDTIGMLTSEGKKIIASIPNGPKHWTQSPKFEAENPHEAHKHNWTNEEVAKELDLKLVGEKEAVGVYANY